MKKNNSLNLIATTTFRYFIYAILVGTMALCITWEARHTPFVDLFGEVSILEYLQVLTLLLTALSAYLAGHVDTTRAPLSALLVGAALVACVREFDFALDRYLFDGAWQLLACVVACFVMLRACHDPRELKDAIGDFLRRPSFGVMAGGFMTVFVFSRLIGRQLLWKAIMGEGYMRVVKNAVEESCELLGYTLIFIGALEFLRETILAVKHSHVSTGESSAKTCSGTPLLGQSHVFQRSGSQEPPSHVYHSRPH